MSDTRTAVDICSALPGVEVAVNTLVASVVGACTADEVLDVWTRLETVRRRLAVVEHAIIAQVQRDDLAHHYGARSTAALARELLRLTPGDAKARVDAAQAAGPRVSLGGEALPPVFEHVAAAQAAGEISERHASLIVKTIDALPGEVAAESGDADEKFLVEQARMFDPRVLSTITARLLETADPDGAEPAFRYRDRMRGLEIIDRPDGSSTLVGELTAEATAIARAVLDPLTAPKPSTEHGPDPRTARQRMHDALLDLVKIAQRAGTLPAGGGVTTTLILTTTVENWEQRRGHVVTGHGKLIPVREAATWIDGHARVIATVFDTAKRVEAYSSSHRIFTEGQRLAMIARDLGCTFPGCDTPPQWCEAHHITEAGHGGPTSTSNGALLCRYHHRHFDSMGWTSTSINGIPHWTPPRWIDPHQQPRRNDIHHPGQRDHPDQRDKPSSAAA